MPSCEPGAELGHYRIVRPLGRGGVGEVYLARELTLERDVAIKLLQPEGGGSGQWRPGTFTSRAQLAEIRICNHGSVACP